MKFQHEWIQATLDAIDVAGTRLRYGKGLEKFWQWYADQGQPELNANTLNKFKRWLEGKGYSSKSIAACVFSVKKALTVCCRPITIEDRMDLIDMQAVKVRQIKGSGYAVSLSKAEVEKLFSVFDHNRILDIRNLAIITLMFYAGLRRSSVAKLELGDYDRESGMLTIREAKGNKTYAIPLHDIAVKNLDEWVNVRYRWANRSNSDNLFLTSKGKGLDGKVCYWTVKMACKRAGLKHYHPHDARSTFITRLHDAGVPVGDIQALAGHASPETTMGYVRTDWSKLKKEVAKLL
jgi:site-specific recombinase XerD